MNMFDQYGIKEVADVTLYSIHKKKNGDVYYVPALYLDTLKISSVEKTAEGTWAQGGLGNARLISWDYGKEINVTLEDALCTPASLGLCWGGILGADWKDGRIKQDFGIDFDKNRVNRLSRFEKAFYPKNDKEKSLISYLLPQTKDDAKDTAMGLLLNSSVVDGTNVTGTGYVGNQSYFWKMFIESDINSIAVVPNKFFDENGRSYPISLTNELIVNDHLGENKFNIIYRINPTNTTKEPPEGNLIIDSSAKDVAMSGSDLFLNNEDKDFIYSDAGTTFSGEENLVDTPIPLEKATHMCICIDNNDNYKAYFYGSRGEEGDEMFSSGWSLPTIPINLSQFKDLDLWLRFSGINEMIYYILTKYENDINYIKVAKLEKDASSLATSYTEDSESLEGASLEGKLWCYVNPKTMSPYPDDYWFKQGEPYYVKSLVIAPKEKNLKSQRITVQAGQFPGMYMMVGETYIRSRDTGEDERLQIKFPLCKIKSNQNLTLEAEGEPTVFTMEMEIARPANGIMMELTSYEVAQRMVTNENGIVEVKDGSTEVVIE